MKLLKTVLLSASLVVMASACEKRTRTANSSATVTLEETDEGPRWQGPSLYQFASIDQALIDARKAATEERWADAAGAAEALLKQQPGNVEAQALVEKAKLEGPNQVRYTDFVRVAARSGGVVAAVKAYAKLDAGSAYHERARPAFEKLRDAWIESAEADARGLAKAGRCDDAKRVATSVIALVPESRPRLENAAGGCKVASPVVVAATMEKTAEKVVAEKVVAEKVVAEVAPTPTPVAPPAPAPVAAAAPIAAPEPRTQSEPIASLESHPTAPPAKAPTPEVVPMPPKRVLPKNVQAAELEALRIGGDKVPGLAAGAKSIAYRDGVKTVQMAVGLCVSETGTPSSVTMKLSSEYTDANEKLISDVHKWRFKPFQVNGVATPVCTAYVFRYETH